MRNITKSIPVKIALIFTALLVSIYVLLVISAVTYIQSLENQAVQNAKAILELNISQLEAEINRIDRLYFDIKENNVDFLKLANWKGTDHDKISLYQVNSVLYEQNGLTSCSEAFFLYLEAADLLFFVDRMVSPIESQELRSSLERSWYIDRNLNWRVGTINGISHIYHTTANGKIFLGAAIDLQAIMKVIEQEIPYENTRVSLNPITETAKTLVVSSVLHHTQNEIYVELDRQAVDQSMPQIARVVLVSGVLMVIVLPALLVILFVRMIARPLRRIERGIIRFGSGEQDYRIPEMKASGEFLSVKNSFNKMADEIQNLKIRQYEEQLEKEQMVVQNILLQIRPHFLLNFFNQIFSMAELQDFEGIQKSALYLSRFFRYLFRSERIATYRSELDLVDAYLELMEERFMDCFTVEKDIDPELLTYRIPPLIVQNFVENIFKYAVSDGNLVDIRLSLKREGSDVVMTIEDDGPGMEENVLHRIQEGLPIEKPDGTHIGILNSTYRLKKLCGDECRLEIHSVLTEGTKIRILLPGKKEEN